MFRTVRHWWNEGSGRHTARLFLFELCVVVIGVLIAQALAGYVQDRADLSRMEAERSRIRFELRSVYSASQSWHAAIPCLDQRMTEVMAGKDFAPGAMRRPSLLSPDYAPATSETLDRIAGRYGIQEKVALTWIAADSEAIANATNVIRDKWGRLMLVDPANGPVTAADHAEARLAAADIKAQLRLIDGQTVDLEPLFTKLGITARDQYNPEKGPARRCEFIWQSGEINPPWSMR